ncbi:MAG: tRNA 2-thiocytidine(32) synthetase TtcA [Clostridia bacterium]|nr:tRNA 2-thiocytidine(32) synthetase TtcA [Clostridia bacterium]
MQKIQGKVRKALDEYKMIDDGDRVAVGLSGGKDSLTLLCALAKLRRYYDKKFEIVAITVDMHNGKSDFSKIKEFCEELNVEYHIIPSQIYDILFNIRKENNPCSLCTRLRRAILSDTAKKLGCNKLALGHHANDLVETFFLSLFYESRLSTFLPVTPLDRTGIVMIRPMLLVWEKEAISAAKNFPVFHNDCPADKHTQREYVKDLLKQVAPNIHQVHEHILSALTHPERNHLFKIEEK